MSKTPSVIRKLAVLVSVSVGIFFMGAIIAGLTFILGFKPAPVVNGVEFYDYLETADWNEIPNDLTTNAVPSLIRRLESDQMAGNKVLAMRSLFTMGPAANAAIPALNRLLQDNEPLVKCMAALSLGKIDRFSQDCMDAMLNGLDSKEQSGAHLTCDTSATYGLQAMGFNKLQSVVWMMGEITPHPLMEQAMPRLKQMLTDNPQHWMVGLLARASWRQERNSESLLPPLKMILNEDKDPQSSIWACVALGEMRSNAREAVTDLQRAGKRNLNVRQAVLAAIEKINSKPTSP